MDWDEIELKWGEMARRVQSQPANMSPIMGLAGSVEAVTSDHAEPPAITASVGSPAE